MNYTPQEAIKVKVETARAALKKGLAEDVVVEITGLNREDIKKLRDEPELKLKKNRGNIYHA